MQQGASPGFTASRPTPCCGNETTPVFNPPCEGGLNDPSQKTGSCLKGRLLRLGDVDVSGEPVEHQSRVLPEIIVALETLVRAFYPEKLLVL